MSLNAPYSKGQHVLSGRDLNGFCDIKTLLNFSVKGIRMHGRNSDPISGCVLSLGQNYMYKWFRDENLN